MSFVPKDVGCLDVHMAVLATVGRSRILGARLCQPLVLIGAFGAKPGLSGSVAVGRSLTLSARFRLVNFSRGVALASLHMHTLLRPCPTPIY